MSNASPAMNLPRQLLLRCCSAQAHTDTQTFSSPFAVRSTKNQQGLGAGIWEQQHLQHTSWCLPSACWFSPGLHSTPRASQHLPAEHQHVAEGKTDLKLTLLCCIFLLICKLPLISERLSAFDLLQHLLSHAALLGNFFWAQLLLNCIVF